MNKRLILAPTLLAPLFLAACATTPNDLAVALCEDSRNCTVTDNTPLYGPPQQQALEKDRRSELPPIRHYR